MWIYFNKQGNLTAKIPHGEIIRQNSTFNFYIAIDKEYFREFFNTSIKPFESYTLEQLVNKINETFEANLTILGVDISTSLTMEIKEFYKIKSTEITYNFEHGKQYLTYHYFGDHNLLTSSGTHEATLQLESKNNDIVKMLGNISFYVEKTYNTENNNINNGTIGGGGNGGNYELPIATPTILGGIKVGEGLNIGATGHLSVSEFYPTREEINDNFLAKNGGDLSGPLKVESNGNSQFISTSQDTAISVKGSNPNSYIKFVGSNGDLGYIGVNSEKKPVFYDTKDKRIILDEDLENALKDYLAKGGGTMSGPLVITGGDAATGAGNIQLDTNGHILAKGTTSTLLGRHDEGSTLLVGHSSHDLKLRGSSTVPTYNDNNIALEKDIYKREELETYVSGVAENYISKDAVEIGDPANKVKFYGYLYEDEDTAIVNFDNKLGTFLGYEHKPTTIKSSSTLKWEDGNGKSNTIIDSSNIGSYAVSLDGDHNKQIRIRASIVPESGYSGLKLGESGHEFMSVYADDFYGTLHGNADTATNADNATKLNGKESTEYALRSHLWDYVTIEAAESTYLKSSEKGVAGGVASLGTDGRILSTQLPSYVDDVIEFTGAFPSEGETSKIYVDTTTNKTYRWSGSGYVEISASLALGNTASTAYRGDLGAQNRTDIDTIKANYLDRTATGDKQIKGGIVPEAENTGYIGSNNLPFSQIYANNFYGTFNAGIGVQLLGRTSDHHTLLGNSSYKTYISSSGELYHRNANTNKDVRILDTDNIGGYSLSLLGTDSLQGNIVPLYRSQYNLGSADKAFNNVYSDYFHGTFNGNATSATKATKDGNDNVIKDSYLRKNLNETQEIHGSIVPVYTNQFELGSTEQKFAGVYATNFYGKATSATKADEATKATNDSDGKVINTTYFKKSGGSLSGDLTSQSIKPGTSNTYNIGAEQLVYNNVYANNFKGTADKATADGNGETISTTYWKKDDLKFELSGSTLKITTK